ncbi:hypothetical protein [Immundisolibacter sp.]|uniref:hypothetical protein n=1 Tax=Immundisolibacter sp. TaxID=1934948 RepID=UPI00356369D0
MPEVQALPCGFETLEPFVSAWALPTMQERNARRVAMPMDQIRAFYDAIAPHMEPLLDRFSALSVDHAMSPAEERLFYLGQAFMEVAMAMEYFGEPDVPDGFDRARWQIVKG